MAQSAIESTEAVWNTVTGCSKISAGCLNFYAERWCHRLKGLGQQKYRNGFRVTLHDDLVELPLQWRKPRLMFVNSVSDLFHEEVPLEIIKRVFDFMERADQHTFQILTKRAERLAQLGPHLQWPRGVSVENSKYITRIDHLRRTGTVLKFLSLEPLLGPIPGVDLTGINWVIVGGESGPKSRPMKKEWAISVRDQCLEAGIPFFFKQWGGRNKKKTGRILEGRTWDEIPSSQTTPDSLSSLALQTNNNEIGVNSR